MDAEFQRRLLAAVETGEPVVLVTCVAVEGSTPAHVGARMLVYPDSAILGTVGGGDVERQAIAEALSGSLEPRRVAYELGTAGTGRETSMTCGGRVELLFEPLASPHRLYVVGAGHCAVELSALAARLGFFVTVIDDRPEWANREKHPAARVVCAPYADVAQHVRFTKDTFIVIMTHGHKADESVLRDCLRREHRYVGMIGSRNKVLECFRRMRADGFSEDELRRVYSPVGFAIGSMTPAEIAVSIAAQIAAVRNGITDIPFSSNPLLARGAGNPRP